MSATGRVPLIRKLEEVTINRIAAGEVVQRPFNAVKEMIENSLDAGATSVSILCKGGGLDMLQIQDSGHGIRKEDLGIVCERFTTSKISSYDDLKTVTTFGFRGEALASITHVANVTITTKTADQPCAYKARYRDGVLVPLKPNDKPEPQPCAGTVGTTITVEDLFHNMRTRKTAFKNGYEEYRRILDVVTKYAIHFGDRGVAFTCKKHGQATPDVHTPSSSSIIGNIKLAYGHGVGRELLTFGANTPATTVTDTDADALQECPAPSFTMSGYVSNANYSSKKGIYIVFINNRLVECASIRRVVDQVYGDILPKNSHPFCYLSLEMPPQHVDVNVHPTKKEVHFLNEDLLLETLHAELISCLHSANQSRTFYASHVLTASADGILTMAPETSRSTRPPDPGEAASTEVDQDGTQEGDEVDENIGMQTSPEAVGAIESGLSSKQLKKKRATANKPTYQPNKMVRTDASLTKIDAFYRPLAPDLKATSSGTAATTSSGNSSSNSTSSRKGAVVDINTLGAFALGGGCACCPPMSGYCQLATPESGDKGSDDNDNDDDGIVNAPRVLAGADNSRLNLPPLPQPTCEYTSVQSLIKDIRSDHYEVLAQALKQHVYVGCVDLNHSLIQVRTKLLLVEHTRFMQELFRQLALMRFGESARLNLAEPVPVRTFVRTALDCPEVRWAPEDGDKDYLSSKVEAVLKEKAAMLKEYFNIRITPNGMLLALPDLLPGYTPDPAVLPIFLLRLATEVDWSDERKCFATVAEELGILFSDLPGASLDNSPEAAAILANQIFPALKAYLLPPRRFGDEGAVVQVAALEELYKVFERC